MTTYSDNLRIPHLDQNVAQPEIPENTAKNIIDSILSNVYVLDTLDATSDISITQTDDPTQATSWQSFMIEINDAVVLTQSINVILPLYERPYIFKNSTTQDLIFRTTANTGSVTIAAGENAYCFSDGSNMERLNFTASGAGSTLISLNDTPVAYDDTKVLRSTAVGTEWYDIVTDLATKLNHTDGTLSGTITNSGTISGGTISGSTLSGTITNSGTISGGIVSDAELVDFSFTRQAVASGPAPDFDSASGSIVTYTNSEIMSPTFTTTQTDTSFKLLITNGEAFAITWPTVSWSGGTKPVLTASGVDLLEFHRINSVWYGTVIDLNLS